MPEINKQYDDLTKPVPVAYIGKKASKKDTLCRSGVVWDGHGDIQCVDPRVASVLLKHKAVFIKAEDLEDFKKNMEASLAEDLKNAANETTTQVADTSDETETDSGPSEEDLAKLESIKGVILSLDQENEDHFTAKGNPKIEAIRARLEGVEVSAADVKAAHKELSPDA